MVTDKLSVTRRSSGSLWVPVKSFSQKTRDSNPHKLFFLLLFFFPPCKSTTTKSSVWLDHSLFFSILRFRLFHIFITILQICWLLGGYSDLFIWGCATQALRPIPIFKGNSGRKRYPFLRIYLDIQDHFSIFFWCLHGHHLKFWKCWTNSPMFNLGIFLKEIGLMLVLWISCEKTTH